MATRAAGDEAATATAATASDAKLAFLDLPLETQREIISHCSQSDLICVALVSRHFHELASAQLYRTFHIIFPDDDDLNFDSPIDGLAGGLDTFTTSDYNYAKHLKDLSMDTLSAGSKGESSYQSYLYSASCGKFLNTLLYLTLKKARALEVFRWNIRVELSRPVYHELHRIASLKKLHIRLQAGESYYIPPPPLPGSFDEHIAPGPSNHWSEIPPLAPALAMIPPPPGTITGPPPALVPPSKSPLKNRLGKRGAGIKDPSTLSGFKDLQSLSVLDIDNLAIVTELNTCIRNSSSTLTELQLSLSDLLASQARKPPPESDPDDSDVDDEFQVVPVTPNASYDVTGPAKVFRAQEERKIQEDALGRIFDIEPALITVPNKKPQTQVNSEETNKDKSTADPREEFYASIKYVSTKLMSLSNGSREFSASQQDILETIEKAARKYVDSSDLSVNGEASNSSNGPEATRSKDDGDETADTPSGAENPTSESSKGKEVEQEPQTNANDAGAMAEGGPAHKPSRGKGDASPEDIDVAHVDGAEDISDDSDDQQPLDVKGKMPQGSTTGTGPGPSNHIAPPMLMATSDMANPASTADRDLNNSAAERVNFETLMDNLSHFQDQADSLANRIQEMRSKGSAVEPGEIKDAEAQLQRFSNSICDVESQIQMIEEEIDAAERQLASGSWGSEPEATQQRMRKYVRDTRGLSLTSLSIHLLPVKASVLSRAINLACLKQLTLLNVGNQAPIWTLLAKENKVRPLALRSIFTDNVSNAFLTCASQLQELHELFLLERSVKYKPESLAPRTTTTMDQIRRLVLKKHIGTLKRLMIKDESSGTNWDSNEKAMILICTRGRQLEELAVSMNIHAVHAFMQYFSGLVNLRAINILHFRNNDTCIWVVREILRFIVDNLSHHPELKLEWIAMEDDRVDRVVRPSETSDEAATDEPKKGHKGKSKGAAVGVSSGQHDAFPALPVDGLDSESESEDDGFDNGTRLRFKTVGPMQFYDVWGVRIFDKEIRSGKL